MRRSVHRGADPRAPRRGLLVGAVLALGLTLAATTPAAAQSPPPSGRPPATGQPPTPQSTTAPTPEVITDAQAASVALGREGAVLVALHAFTADPSRLSTIVDGFGFAATTDHATLLDELQTAEAAAAPAQEALQAAGVRLAPETRQALGPLSTSDIAALESGGTISLGPEVYVRSLEQLLDRNGEPPPQPTPPDPVALHAKLEAILASGPPTVPTTVPPTTIIAAGGDAVAAESTGSSTGSSTLPWVIAGVLALLLAAVAALLLGRRRGPGGKATPAALTPDVENLLEVSRRLTTLTTTAEVARAIVREGMGLVNADAAALVRVTADGLVSSYETQAGLLVPERLDEGVLARVAETGQPVVQLSATEPALRNLPVALAALPIVGGGRVDAVVLLVRSDTRPFATPERDLLAALSPIAGAALQSSRHAEAAIEQSLLDPLTGAGNRRRLDRELTQVLDRADGRPTSLIMVDLDEFKAVNDTHGHQAGDELLRAIASILRADSRPFDRVYRYGGEEFCVVLPETDLHGAREVAERIRSIVASTGFDVGIGRVFRATASFGVATTTDTDPAQVIAQADAALYQAKRGGRDRVVASD